MRMLLNVLCHVTLLNLVIFGGSVVAASEKSDLSKSLERLQASSDEWQREVRTYRLARKNGVLPRTELEAYAEFLASLRLRMLRQCEETRRLGGNKAVEKFDCARPRQPRGVVISSFDGSRILTEEEKRQRLQAKLNMLEGEIDETLLKRQQEIKQSSTNLRQRNASAPGSGSSGGAGQGGTSAGSTSKGGSKEVGSSASGGAHAGRGNQLSTKGLVSAPGGPREKQHPRAAKGEKSNEDGSDDDVVARQLREAAEKETDPLLKKKLWEEYRKYKGGQK